MTLLVQHLVYALQLASSYTYMLTIMYKSALLAVCTVSQKQFKSTSIPYIDQYYYCAELTIDH